MDALFVDTYPRDKPVNWDAFIAAGPPWHGAIFKLSEGTEYQYADWAKTQRAKLLASPRYGVDLFDGYFHFLKLDEDGTAQADAFWHQMQMIGGEQKGTLWATVDLERGGQRAIGDAAHVRKVTSDWLARYRQLSGRDGTLYGGELIRSLGLDRMGAGRSWVALYNSGLHGNSKNADGTIEDTPQFLARTGTDLKHLLFWQFCGAVNATQTESFLVGYPTRAPGAGGALDIQALEYPGGLAGMRTQLAADFANTPK